jgi:hypothetical protein
MKRLFSVVLLFTAVASGCTNDTDSGNGTEASLAGRIALVDSTGIVLSDFSGTTVSLDNTKFATTTDASGNWQIHGVPEGQYDITASNPGFGTYHWFEEYVNGGRLDLEATALMRMKNIAPFLASAQFYSPTPTLGIRAEMPISSSQTPWAGVIVYCDLDSTVNPSDAHYQTLETTLIDSMKYGGTATEQQFMLSGLKSGQTLYISASTYLPTLYNFYGPLYSFSTKFYDPIHHNYRYASLGPKSNVIKVVMP